VNIPGKQPADVTFEFDSLDLGNASLADAVVTFGDADVVQTVVPLGQPDGLVANEPKQVLGPTTVVNKDVTYGFTTCELRADYAPGHEQAQAGRRVLACFADATFTGQHSFHIVDERNYQLKQPNGSRIGAIQYPIMNLNTGVTAPDIYLAFAIKEPVKGAYAIVLSSRDLGESETEATFTEVPLTL
jgi:hypothetical protein